MRATGVVYFTMQFRFHLRPALITNEVDTRCIEVTVTLVNQLVLTHFIRGSLAIFGHRHC